MAETPPLSEPEPEPEIIPPEEVERREHEQQWLNSRSPSEMLGSLQGMKDIADRKFYLFHINSRKNAFKKLRTSSSDDKAARKQLEGQELYVEGKITHEEMESKYHSTIARYETPLHVAMSDSEAYHFLENNKRTEVIKYQIDILHDIMGNWKVPQKSDTISTRLNNQI